MKTAATNEKQEEETAPLGGPVIVGVPDLEGADAVVMLADLGPAPLLEDREPVAGRAVGAVLRGV